MSPDLDRFLALVRRELGADQSRVLDADDGPEEADPRDLRCRLPDGRVIAVRFDAAPPEREAKQRRLEMLASAFDAVVEDAGVRTPRSRPPVSQALQDELQLLTTRAGALNAVVVDANSPVIWGAAHADGLGPTQGTVSDRPGDSAGPSSLHGREASVHHFRGATELTRTAGANDVEPVGPGEPVAHVTAVSRAAVDAVRGLADVAASRKGKHVRHVERQGPAPFAAHSFAGIYLLVIVYDAPFDELRAERSIVDALPRVERLVLALPPLDPSPVAGARAIAMRPRRR